MTPKTHNDAPPTSELVLDAATVSGGAGIAFFTFLAPIPGLLPCVLLALILLLPVLLPVAAIAAIIALLRRL